MGKYYDSPKETIGRWYFEDGLVVLIWETGYPDYYEVRYSGNRPIALVDDQGDVYTRK